MELYIFTYGTSDTYPFYGGWFVVGAPNRNAAVSLFRMVHPDAHEGIVNCCDIYRFEDFEKTSMWVNGNFGYRAHDHIYLGYEVMGE